jgi:hypothetical protein
MKHIKLLIFLSFIVFVACKKENTSNNGTPTQTCQIKSYTFNDSLEYTYKMDNKDRIESITTKNEYSGDSTILYYAYDGKIVETSDGQTIYLNDRNLADSSDFDLDFNGTKFPGKARNKFNTANQMIQQVLEFDIFATHFVFTSDYTWVNGQLTQKTELVESSSSPKRTTIYNYTYENALIDNSAIWQAKHGFLGNVTPQALLEETSLVDGIEVKTTYEYVVYKGNIELKIATIDNDKQIYYRYQWLCQ